MKFAKFISRFALLGTIGLIGGCAHQPGPAARPTTATPQPTSTTYQSALDGAFREIELGERAPAQATNTGISLQQLNLVRPGKFKVFVFPKISSVTNKSSEDAAPLFKSTADEKASRLGKPSEFEVSTLAENPCVQFIDKGLFAKYSPKDFFDPALARDRSKRCAIVRITSLKLKSANRALIKRDDQLEIRLFLDDNYRLQGYELDKFVNGQNRRTVRVKADAQISSSGLSLFPMDIPPLDILARATAPHANLNVGDRLDNLAVAQIRKISGAFAPTACPGTEVRYNDHFGTPVEVGWCDQMPFPQYMENGRFVAITQPLDVR